MSIIQTIVKESDVVNQIGQEYEEFLKMLRRCSFSSSSDSTVFVENSRRMTVGTHTVVDCVFWIPSMIACGKCCPNSDAISFDFSGCWMARLNLENEELALHVNTDTYEPRDRKTGFLHYLEKNQNAIKDISIFQPLCLYERHNSLKTMLLSSEDDRIERKVWGLITTTGECYSIIVDAKSVSYIESEGCTHYMYSLYAIIKHPKYGMEILQLPEVLDFLTSGKPYKQRCEALEGIWIENYKRLQYIYKAY